LPRPPRSDDRIAERLAAAFAQGSGYGLMRLVLTAPMEADDFSALFGLDMADGDAPAEPQKKGRTRSKPVEPRTPEPMKTAARKVPSRKPAKPARTPVKVAAPPAVQPAAPAKKTQNRAKPAAPARPASKRRVPGRPH
jgi:hypothetical protein